MKKQDILRVYSVVSTKIRKSPDTPSEFQLQPNEEPTQHAPRQVQTHTQEQPGNPWTVKRVKEVVEHETSLEIVDEEVPADFNTGKHQFNTETENHSAKENMTRRLDGFLDSFEIVNAVPVDFNTGKDPCDLQPDSNGSMESDTESTESTESIAPDFKSPTILQADTWKKGLEVVLQPNSTLVMRALTRS